MKRLTQQPAAVRAPAAPFVDFADTERRARVIVRSGLRAVRRIDTTVRTTVSTNTHRLDPDDANVGITITVGRTFQNGDTTASFDIAASELDVFVAAITEAVRIARETGVIDAALVKCAEVRDAVG